MPKSSLYSALDWTRHNPPPKFSLAKELGLTGARQYVKSVMSRPVRKMAFDVNYELGFLGAKQLQDQQSAARFSGGGDIPQNLPSRRAPGISWSEFGYDIEGAPSQWKALAPSRLNAETERLATMNMLIPFLSPEDQLRVANELATQEPDTFGHLAGMTIGSPSIEQQADMSEQYGGRRKFLHALEALTRFRGAAGKSEKDMGAGYKYLTDLVSRMADFSGGGAPQSRLDYMNMMSQIQPTLETAPQEYQGVAQMLLQPSFTGAASMGQMMGNQYQWGTPNQQLWT